jgi:hypothetical protein
MRYPVVLTIMCGIWAGYLLSTDQPTRAFDVLLGGILFLGLRAVAMKLLRVK